MIFRPCRRRRGTGRPRPPSRRGSQLCSHRRRTAIAFSLSLVLSLSLPNRYLSACCLPIRESSAQHSSSSLSPAPSHPSFLSAIGMVREGPLRATDAKRGPRQKRILKNVDWTPTGEDRRTSSPRIPPPQRLNRPAFSPLWGSCRNAFIVCSRRSYAHESWLMRVPHFVVRALLRSVHFISGSKRKANICHVFAGSCGRPHLLHFHVCVFFFNE